MSISSISQYLKAIESISTLQSSNYLETTPQTNSDPATQMDTYESTVSASADIALPSDTYNDIMELIKVNKQNVNEEPSAPTEDDFTQTLSQLNESTTSTTFSTTSTESNNTGTSSGGNGGGDSSESETTTETIIGPDGSVYLKTTTTSEGGEETVTIKKVASGDQSMSDSLTNSNSNTVNSTAAASLIL